MRLRILHRTEYRHDRPIDYLLQRLRLTPRSSRGQTVRTWSLTAEGGRRQAVYRDHFGNDTDLMSFEGSPGVIAIAAEGEVETTDTAGVSGPGEGHAPLWLFGRDTPLTQGGERVLALADAVGGGDDIARLHRLMAVVGERVAYEVGATDAATTAEAALERGAGVCQDHAHVFIAAARRLGFPARYVSGYLFMPDATQQAASHAWAEAHVPHLGWVAFDPANGISPDDRYVVVAVGRDYRDAAPVAGLMLGRAGEELAVRITVEQ